MKKSKIKAMCFILAAMCAAVPVMLGGAGVSAENETVGKGTDTVYSIGSVSKMYVTAAAMQLADKGLISLDEPVASYITDFEMADERYKDITVRMLMNHTSGIMGSTDSDSLLFEDNDRSAYNDFLENLKGQRLKDAPGGFSCYCNDGFDLLEILVERVSGMDFTEYMNENIVKPIGGVQTGTYVNVFQSPYQVGIYDKNNQPYAHEYHIGIGAGGVLSTAYELCRFGGTFFRGDNTLLSESAKDEMAECESSDIFQGNYALGWDDADVYKGQGVKVVEKGGDIFNQHAMLMVAPDEKISVAVCTSGGSSGVDGMMAKCLMNIALAENGIEISEPERKTYKLSDSIPEEYRQYEGLYANNGDIIKVSFPDMKYMKTEICDSEENIVNFYKYSEEGKFISVKGDIESAVSIDNDAALCTFEKLDNGKIYLTSDTTDEYAKLGKSRYACYYAEKLEPGTAGDAAKRAWKERAGKYYLTGGKYSNAYYSVCPAIEIKVSDADDGYLYGSGVQEIKDENHAAAFVNIPGHNGRDLSDITAGKADGADCLTIDGSKKTRYISESVMTELDSDVKEVTFGERSAKWYTIGGNMGGSVVSFDRTEHTSVYVYDKYDNCTYSTYMSGFDNRIPLPTEGKIVFIGEKGEKISISQKQ